MKQILQYWKWMYYHFIKIGEFEIGTTFYRRNKNSRNGKLKQKTQGSWRASGIQMNPFDLGGFSTCLAVVSKGLGDFYGSQVSGEYATCWVSCCACVCIREYETTAFTNIGAKCVQQVLVSPNTNVNTWPGM